MEFVPTERRSYENGSVVLEVQNDESAFAWRLVVDGVEGPVTENYYPGIYEHAGWLYASAYWDGKLPVERPFRAVVAAD